MTRFGDAPLKAEGQPVDYGYGGTVVKPTKPKVATTYVERRVPVKLEKKYDKLIEQFNQKGYDYIGTQIESINFLNGIILITKR